MVESLKDKYLIFKAKRGYPEAIAEIFDRYFQKIYRFVYFRLAKKEDAEDLTSDVFLQLQTHLHRGGDIKNVSGLLYQIARNKIVDFYRVNKINQVPIHNLETGEETLKNLVDFIADDDAVTKFQNKLEFQAVFHALQDLKPEYREVVMLHYINEMSIKELSQALDKKENNVRVMLFRALSSLRERLSIPQEDSSTAPKNPIDNAQQRTDQNFKESNTS